MSKRVMAAGAGVAALAAVVGGAVGNHLPWPAALENHPLWTSAAFFAIASVMAVLAAILSMADASGDGESATLGAAVIDSPASATVVGDQNVTAIHGGTAVAAGGSLTDNSVSMSLSNVTAGKVVQIGGINAQHFEIVCRRRGSLPLEPALIHLPPEDKMAPSFLLRARFGVVPFVDHSGLLEEVLTWARSSQDVSALVVSGRGGAGKSRVAVEACRTLTDEGWLCGLLASSATPDQLAAIAEEQDHDRLLVVDYAEARAEHTAQLIGRLASMTQSTRARVLLLVRSPEVDPKRLCDLASESSDLVDSVLARADVLALADFEPTEDQRQVLFHAAAEVFGDGPFDAATAGFDLSEPKFANALAVVLAAFLSTRSEAAALGQEPLDAFLAHEARYWNKHAAQQCLNVGHQVQALSVAAVTLAGANTLDDAVELLGCIPPIGESIADRHKVAQWLHELYPGDQQRPGFRWISPLEPDLVGETLIARAVVASPELLDRLLSLNDGPLLRGALRTLARATGDPTSPLVATEQAIRIVDEHVKSHLIQLTDLAVVAASTPEELAALAQDDALAPTLAQLVSTLPLDLTVLAASARIEISGVITDSLDLALCQSGVDLLDSISESGADDLAVHSTALHSLSFCLARMGRRDEALLACEEAIDIRRGLVEQNPTAYRAELAKSLNNHSIRLGAVGRPEDALVAIEEAVTLRRSLAAENPDAYLNVLARSLSNQSVRLAAVGRPDDAMVAIEEAVKIRRRLVEEDPALYVPDLAGSLDNRAVRLAEAGRPDDALAAIEEAVKIRRGLVKQNPAAYLPPLAVSLDNLAGRLAEVGRPDDALAAIDEAVKSRRGLVKQNRAAFLPALAISLDNWAVRLAEVGRPDHALAAIEEAVLIRRRLAEQNRAAYAAVLASSLENKAARLGELGRGIDAELAIDEAVGFRRWLREQNRSA